MLILVNREAGGVEYKPSAEEIARHRVVVAVQLDYMDEIELKVLKNLGDGLQIKDVTP